MAILNLFQYVKDTVTFPAGHVIYKEDEAGTGQAYVVLEGEVEVRRANGIGEAPTTQTGLMEWRAEVDGLADHGCGLE